ncbi:MAG: hypothetical protein ACYCU7_16450 [Acidimicrobiales bacterium]
MQLANPPPVLIADVGRAWGSHPVVPDGRPNWADEVLGTHKHCQYQPHLRHFQALPPRYIIADPNPELFQVIVDTRQDPHVDDCPQCQSEV